ncbi:MAG: rod shape-determining protein RodA [Phycisphaerae bacterium]|nr:rod shape-determining protein RodA [Phycisphaerae bacterium]
MPRFAVVFITAAMLALMLVGILAIRISEQAEGNSGFAYKQTIFAIVGVIVFAICAAVPYPKFGKAAYPLFGVTLALLVLVFFLPEVRGSHRWIDLKFFKVQPSELAKLSLIILLAWYLRFGDHYRSLVGLIPPFLLTLVPMMLILREPDLGTSLLFLPTLYVMLFMAGAKRRHLFGIVCVGTVLLFIPIPQSTASMSTDVKETRKALAYWTMGSGDSEYVVSASVLAVMKKHQLERIDGFLRQDDPRVIQGKGYHLHRSKIVLGSGKVTGRGDWAEAEIYFRMLPDDHTDFIFSIIGGQWGFVGCVILLGLYIVIFVLGVEIAYATHDAFGRLLAVGVLGLLVSQIFINVGMTMGLMPITGMTLPFISYGGSSLIINCAALGLLVNVGHRKPILLSRRPFEHKEPTAPIPYRPLEKVAGGARWEVPKP